MRLIKMAALVACLSIGTQSVQAEGYNYDPTVDLDHFVGILFDPDTIARITPDGDGGERRIVRIDVGAISVTFEIHTVAGSMACVIEHFELYEQTPIVNLRDEGCDGSLDRISHASQTGYVTQPLTAEAQQHYVKSVDFFAGSFEELMRIMDPVMARDQIMALANDPNTRRVAGAGYENYLLQLIKRDGAGGPDSVEHGYYVRFFGNDLTATLQYNHIPDVGLRIFSEHLAGNFTVIDANGDHLVDIMEQTAGYDDPGIFEMVNINQATLEAGAVHLLSVLQNLADGEVWFMADDTPGS